MNIINFKKFLGTIIIGYFGVKIYYNIFLLLEIKKSDNELSDFSTTCVLACIMYFLTNFEEVINDSYVYYGGFVIGLNLIVINNILNFDDDTKNIILYLLIFIYSLFFLYFYIAESTLVNDVFLNPLIILISFISITGGILLTTIPLYTSNGVVKKRKLNITSGILCWIGSLLLIHTNNDNNIGSIIQSILIGGFVSYFSYFGPKYIFDTEVIQHSELNLPNLDLAKEKNNISGLNSSIHTLNEYLNKIVNASEKKTQDINDEYKFFILTNRWISGLSLISVFVVVSLIYSKTGIDMNNN